VISLKTKLPREHESRLVREISQHVETIPGVKGVTVFSSAMPPVE
jgi:hypothetical protein